MIPDIEFVMNPLLADFIKRENDSCLDARMGSISLTRLSQTYNDGLKGYFTSMIASSSGVDDLSGRMDEFKAAFMENINDLASRTENPDSGRFEKARAAKSRCEELWKSCGSSILTSIKNAFLDDWEEASITAYFIPDEAEQIARSNPLIIPVKHDDANRTMQVLTHELIHRHAATARGTSLYALLSMEARENGIGRQESYGRILHPLLFYSAWHFVKEVQVGSEPFYIHEEFNNNKFFHNTVLILEKYWGKYRSGKISKEDFIFLFYKDYMDNTDRIERRRMVFS